VMNLSAGSVPFENDSTSFAATGSGNTGFTPR
jgi:hypothetical protein